MRKILLINIFLYLLLISCANKREDVTDKKTKIFSNYLISNFNIKLPNKLHYYVLVSEFGCKGCIDQNLKELDEFINRDNVSYFTFIALSLKSIPNTLAGKAQINIDKEKVLESLNLDFANVTLIKVKEKKLTFIKSFNPNDPPITEFIKLQ